jgi:PAS domain S-box-containing protein
VDRISDAALGTSALDPFLHKLLQAMLETTETVDTGAVFLREEDVLRLRAAVGIEDELSRGFSMKIGEGVAGKVAADGQPISLRHAAVDPLVKSRSIRENGVRALYGVPLIHAGSVVGVTYMGSRTAFEFSDEDKLLFRTMASRATSVIIQAQLVADLEKTISDRDRLLSQAAGERARLEHILNQVPTGILIAEAPTGVISFVNKRCQEILHHPLGQTPPSQYNGWKLVHHGDGRPYAPEEMPRYRALRGEEVVDEIKVKRRDGTWATVRAHAAPVRDPEGRVQNAIIAFDDISGQKRYEERLRFLSEASRQLAESVDYEATLAKIARLAIPGIADWFVVDLRREGELSPVAVAHSDPAKVELVNQVRRRFPPDLDAPGGLARVLREGVAELYEVVTDELLVASAQSEEHLESMRALGMRSAMIVPLRVRGRTEGAISFVSAESGRLYDRDDVEMAQGLADRAAMAIENARLFQDAARAIRLREEVLAVVSHDLRNPLGSISMGAAMLFKKGAADPRTRKQLETMMRAAGRMDHLIGDLLDLASIQAGRLAVERQPQEIAPILSEAVELAEPLAKANAQTLKSEILVREARCSVDRDRVLQLLSNLLGNAKKFCPPGGSITVRAVAKANEVECSIADTGPGIPPKDVPHIFDPYWSAKHEARKGVGLGLYISKGIVEAHGGRIWVENRPGAGATFYFTLPLA